MCILKTKYLFNNLLMSPTVLFTPKTSVKFPINPILKIKFLKYEPVAAAETTVEGP